MQLCTLMHKNTRVAGIVLDDTAEKILSAETRMCEPEYGPYLGNLTLQNLNMWWKNRAIPGHRENIREILEAVGCATISF